MTTKLETPEAFVAGDPPLPADPVIEAYMKDVDRTLLRANLKLTVQQRLEDLMSLQRFAEELRKAPRTRP